jgi:NADH-quinone oxidoreductase subunit L
MNFAVIALAFLSIVGGFVWMPAVMGGYNPFGRFLASVFPSVSLADVRGGHAVEAAMLWISVAVSLLGIYLAYLYFRRQELSAAFMRLATGRAVYRFFFAGWGFDWLYDWLFVRPYKAVAFGNRSDFIDKFYAGLAWTARCANAALSFSQTGRLRHYATGLVIGAVILGALLLLR